MRFLPLHTPHQICRLPSYRSSLALQQIRIIGSPTGWGFRRYKSRESTTLKKLSKGVWDKWERNSEAEDLGGEQREQREEREQREQREEREGRGVLSPPISGLNRERPSWDFNPGLKSPVRASKQKKAKLKERDDESRYAIDDEYEQGGLEEEEPPQPLDPRDAQDPPPPPQQPHYPVVVAQALENIERLPNCVLLTRVGGFYELYFSHAELYAASLGLKLAKKKTNAGMVPMAGFPFWQLNRYLKMLVMDQGRYVAICEEYQIETNRPLLEEELGEWERERAVHKWGEDDELIADPKFVKPEGPKFERRIARIVTPGTLIDETWINQGENHYIMAIEKDAEEYALGWADLGTGEMWCQSCGAEEWLTEVSRIGPRELLVSKECAEAIYAERLRGRQDRFVVTVYGSGPPEVGKNGRIEMFQDVAVMKNDVDRDEVKKLTTLEFGATARLLDYIGSRLPGIVLKLQSPVRIKGSDVMGIDVNSMRGLEIKATLRDGGSKGSLLHTISRTVTRGGMRLLGNRLASPSTDIGVIEGRLDLVQEFEASPTLQEDITELLKSTHDSQRILQKFALGRGNADDLVALARTMEGTEAIVARLNKTKNDSFKTVAARLKSTGNLAQTILNSIDEEGLRRQQNEVAEVASTIGAGAEMEDVEMAEKEADGFIEVVETGEGSGGAKRDRRKRVDQGMANALQTTRFPDADTGEAWVMKRTASEALNNLHIRLQAMIEAKEHLEVHLRNKLNVQSLTLKWSPSLGHYCHIKGKKDYHAAGIRGVTTSRSTKSFLQPEWTKLGDNMGIARLRIRAEEKIVFQSIVKKLTNKMGVLRRNAEVLNELDVGIGFARLARELNLKRPAMHNKTYNNIVGGRHITVEAGLLEQGKKFVENDCFVGENEKLWLVTGPNMAGKSTFLRQNALISILAQVGSYVPVVHAELGIVDKIFSRIGSADNLYNSQSTFMVEMLETAEILRSATPRSFVIMDEIGRGTASHDGLAVAYATLDHLVTINRSRTLFATHFHELADMAAGEKRVGCYCTDIADAGEAGWSYVHKLRKGVNRESHALKVAQMAGMPTSMLRIAEKVLVDKK